MSSMRVASHDMPHAAQIIPLNGRARIVRRTVFPKSGKMVESARADSREGKLRSQLNISPEGHCHMRCGYSTAHSLYLAVPASHAMHGLQRAIQCSL